MSQPATHHTTTAVKRTVPPQPLARGTLTFNSPSEPGVLVGIEFIVTDRDVPGMAGWLELPEIREAGWISHSCTNFEVLMRSIY